MALSAGRRLGPYEILAPLGVGSMGEVYCARERRKGKVEVAQYTGTGSTDVLPISSARR